MLDMFKNFFGGTTKQSPIAEVMAKGATVIDVRSPGEYAGGHLKNSVNIPLNVLPSKLATIPKGKPIVTCCASGMRSASARTTLLQAGFTEVYNGGGWASLKGYEQ